MLKNIFTKEQEQDIINQYSIQHKSLRAVGDQYKVSRFVIKRILTENNVPIRHDNHKYKADYSIFETIDNSEKAYWLGFLAADGCNFRRAENATIIINIHQKDYHHLEQFREFCKSDVNIQKYTTSVGFSSNTPMCRIALNSIKMSDDLTKLGVTPRKSLTLQPPKINSKYYLPFILGYFDGDGSIYQLKTGEFGISFEGTKEILVWIIKVLNLNECKLEKRYDDNKNNYYFRVGGTHKPYLALKPLYESCNVHLDRKYKIYKKLEQVVLSRKA